MSFKVKWAFIFLLKTVGNLTNWALQKQLANLAASQPHLIHAVGADKKIFANFTAAIDFWDEAK